MTYMKLFEPLTIGAIKAPNRIIMAPMTRARAKEPGDVPTPMMAEYYGQRASAGLIITEATQISYQAKGWAGAPGIHTEEQMEAWRAVNAVIHKAGGRSAVQVWHTGRVSHNALQPGGLTPVAPSAISANAKIRLRDTNGEIVPTPSPVPRVLDIDGIKQIVADFGQAAANARASDFDLIELHGAHGYLIHQFLSPVSNERTDQYGGSIENRSRFALEALDAAIAQWAADRIGFRIYPLGAFNGLENDESQEEAALYLIRELAKRNIAYLHISEPDWVGGTPFRQSFREAIRAAFPGVIIAAGAYTPEKAEKLISEGLIDAVAFGRLFAANPDLVERIRLNAEMNPLQKETLYAGDAEGYVDYPFLKQDARASA